ncbi:MAG: hypothetical protein ACE5LU_10865, partial [Anaerolineae bacterium]
RRYEMRYQDVASRLILAANGAGLTTYLTRDELELEEMSRTFRAHCVLEGWDPPHEIRAEFQFFWPCEQAAHSLYGTEGLCAFYHGEEVACTHYELDPEPMIELQIEYCLPDHAAADLDSTAAMTYFAQRVQEAHRESVEHENLVVVRFRSVFHEDRLRISSAVASHYWLIEGEELEDEDILSSILASVCNEVHDFLLRLADLFPEPGKKGRRRRSRRR